MTNGKKIILACSSLLLLSCLWVSEIAGRYIPGDPYSSPKDWEDDSMSVDATQMASTSSEVDLTPQELATVGLHTYEVSSYDSDGALIQTSNDQREFKFSKTGVEIHYPGLGYISTSVKIKPNEYRSESGYSTMTFTDYGFTSVEQNGASTVWTRTD